MSLLIAGNHLAAAYPGDCYCRNCELERPSKVLLCQSPAGRSNSMRVLFSILIKWFVTTINSSSTINGSKVSVFRVRWKFPSESATTHSSRLSRSSVSLCTGDFESSNFLELLTNKTKTHSFLYCFVSGHSHYWWMFQLAAAPSPSCLSPAQSTVYEPDRRG